MRRPLIDVRDDEALSSVLSQVFLFVEHVNSRASQEARRLLNEKLRTHSRGDGKPLGQEHARELLRSLARLELDFKNIIREVFQRLASDGGHWLDQSLLLSLLRQEGIQPQIQPCILQSVTDLLLRPARVVPKQGSWKIEGQPKALPRASGIDFLTEKLWIYESEQGPLLATRPLLTEKLLFSRRFHVYFWEEPFDAVGIARLFLAEILGETGRSADHYLQRWLRATFHLAYNKESKYSLAVVCELFNNIFYGNANPTTQAVHNQRTPTVSGSLLLKQLTEVLQKTYGTDGSAERALLQALGLYLFFGFCRQLRRRFFWVDLEGVNGEKISEDISRCLTYLDGESCVSALRPLGYTYFQCRVFGFISSIPGLSNIFRGGLLHRTSSGRAIALLGPAGIGKTVMALQLMADFARFGGLSIYISLEESFDAILDRLVTFGFIDPQKFQVCSAGSDLARVVRKARIREPEKGLLIFYQASEGTLFEIIESIAENAKEWPQSRPRALVVDSVNALQFTFVPSGQTVDTRRYIYSVVTKIETKNFFGLLLGEKEGEYYQILPYLADTVLEMGFDENAHTRWFEIRKCRVQDYHEGKHPLRIHDGRGVIVYPSLGSRRNSLRGRVRSTLSQWRVIPYPYPEDSEFRGLPEKGSTLIWGPQASGKTLVTLRFLTEPSILRPEPGSPRNGKVSEKERWRPQNIMIITFRTSEKNFIQMLQRHQDLAARWDRIPHKWLRWYSPGSNLTAEQIVSEMWRYIKESRRKGIPVDRMLFDETEVAEDVLTALRRDPLFWPTVLELTSTEAATSFFVCGQPQGREISPVMQTLRGSMDNVLHVYQREEDGRIMRHIEVQQHPESVSASRKTLIEVVQ